MGQQQLLLLVLGIVVVGLAVVVGIQSYNESRHKAELDRQANAIAGLAGEVVGWYQKPTANGGGGGRSANLTRARLTMAALGRTQSYTDANRTGDERDGMSIFVGPVNGVPIIQAHAFPLQADSPISEVVLMGPYPECFVQQQGRYNANWTSFATTAPANPNPSRCTW